MARVLFILKERSFGYGGYGHHHPSSGLHNSAGYVYDMLLGKGIASKLVHVVDNNSIDREVALFLPTHVFIEAYWVIPEKFEVLSRLHPTVKWIVRNHSEIPFLSLEGMAMEWTLDYVSQDNVMVSSNSPYATDSLRVLIRSAYPWLKQKAIDAKTPLLTNVYPNFQFLNKAVFSDRLHIGCFGAIRPLKNQLIQAVAAIRYAEGAGRRLSFHINSSRIEGRAGPILNNLRQLFDRLPHHKLVEHEWMGLDAFLYMLRQMHLVMQMSFSETFNFVAANAVSEGTPIVVSPEVPWAVEGVADPTDDVDIAEKIDGAVDSKRNVRRNGRSLNLYSQDSKVLWMKFLR